MTLALELARQEFAERSDLAVTGVTLADLVGSKGFVELTDRLNFVPVPLLADVCRGQPFTWPPADEYWDAAKPDVEVGPDVEERRAARTAALVEEARVRLAAAASLDVAERSGLTERRLARELKVDQSRLAHASFRLWKSTFSEERDRRAGPDASQQKKGRITRGLRAELVEKALADGND
ncbi:MAG: hypothetical protein ACRDTN_13155 [Mycobacterium sp.]